MKSTKKSDQESDQTTSDDSDQDVHEDKTVKKVWTQTLFANNF